MKRNLKTLIRTLQTYFPSLVDRKYDCQRLLRVLFRMPFERDFNALRHFPKNPSYVFLDVGGNRGQSIDAIRLFLPEVELHSYEPNPALAAKLKQRYVSDKNLTIHTFALGDDVGRFKLNIPSYRGYVFDGLASLDYESARSWLRDNILGYSDRHLAMQYESCQVRKLDDLRMNPFFIKIDVEGFELETLKGAVETIRLHTPILLVEAVQHQPQIVEFLRPFGYDVWSFEKGNIIKGGSSGQNSFLMTHDKRQLLS